MNRKAKNREPALFRGAHVTIRRRPDGGITVRRWTSTALLRMFGQVAVVGGALLAPFVAFLAIPSIMVGIVALGYTVFLALRGSDVGGVYTLRGELEIPGAPEGPYRSGSAEKVTVEGKERLADDILAVRVGRAEPQIKRYEGEYHVFVILTDRAIRIMSCASEATAREVQRAIWRALPHIRDGNSEIHAMSWSPVFRPLFGKSAMTFTVLPCATIMQDLFRSISIPLDVAAVLGVAIVIWFGLVEAVVYHVASERRRPWWFERAKELGVPDPCWTR